MTQHLTVLRQAYDAWRSASTLRQARNRNKRFTFGDQWGDHSLMPDGSVLTDWERFSQAGTTPVTNNLLRQLVKTVVGRFRAQVINQEKAPDDTFQQVARDNLLDELDSRALEEFLISGCCIQRVDQMSAPDGTTITRVENVNTNHFFVNTLHDCRAHDCVLVGQLHEMTIAQLLRRVADGSRRKAAWVRRVYTDDVDARVASCITQLGADSQNGADFWVAQQPCRVRAIEVWTLESQEVMVCHNRRTAQLEVVPLAQARRFKRNPDVAMRWDVETRWHCRWFAPTGDVLAEWDSPYRHRCHPFAMKFYPLVDGEVHAMVEDIIDQQKYLNRLISLVDQVMMSSAKGVLLFPESALPDGFTWADVRRVWSNPGGILPYSPLMGEAKPEQIQSNASNLGAYEMINLQMKLLEEVSGVHGALQGKNVSTGGSATLYQLQSDNADLALTDLYDTFNTFRRQRDSLITGL